MSAEVSIARVCTAILVCMIVVAFVLSAVTSHAAYGDHGVHISSEIVSDGHDGEKLLHGISTDSPDQKLSGQLFENCCDGLCLSAMIANDQFPLPQFADKKVYLAMDDQSTSFEPIGNIRPPRALI